MSSETLPTESTKIPPFNEPPNQASEEVIAAAAQAALLGTGDPSVKTAGF